MEASSITSVRVLRPSEDWIFQDPGYHVWCGSLTEWDGEWWLFYSRWPVALGFEAWATSSEIALARGKSPTGPFTPMNHVLLPQHQSHSWERNCAHNPTVVVENKQLYLAYMANRGPFHGNSASLVKPSSHDSDWWEHRNNQRIGIATALHPTGPWHTLDQPIIDASSAGWDSLLVNNPSIFRRADAGWTMIYKAVAKGDAPFGGAVLHGVAEASHPLGPYNKIPSIHPFSSGESLFPAEDPFAWYDSTAGIYRSIVKDMHGSLSGEGRSLTFFQSRDGRNWVASPLAAISATEIRWNGVRCEAFARIERPQVILDQAGRAVSLQLACLAAATDSVAFSLSIPLPRDFFYGDGAAQLAINSSDH